MDTRILSALKQHHHFESWRNRSTLDTNLFIWPAHISGQELPGWEPYRIQVIPPPQPAAPPVHRTTRVGAGPRTVQSLWRRPAADAGMLLSVDLFECDSRAAAHELTVKLLGEFQSALIARYEQDVIGDVAFGFPGNRLVIVFARANVVLLMRNAGRRLVPIDEAAQQFDRALIARPAAPALAEPSELPSIRVSSARQRGRGSRQLKITAPGAQRFTYKFFSPSGEVHHEGGRLLYQPAAAGQHTLEVYAVAPDGTVYRSLHRVLE